MKKISEILSCDIYNPYTLYTNDLYNLTVAYQIKGVSISKLNELYKKLPIHSKKDIVINDKILNEKEELGKYILKKYK